MAPQAHYECLFGTLTIGYEQDAVTLIRLNAPDKLPHSPAPITDLAAAQLEAYFEGRRTEFDFPIRLTGTAFQKAVWEELLRIPYGEIRSYGQIASAIGKPKAPRAVGQAANRNPIWIVVPCHRVVGSNASLTGYAGGLSLKQALLELENSHK